MCIFVASEAFSQYAFLLASNRDEFLDRQTEPAHWWPGRGVYAPRDVCKGGTWMGVRNNRLAILVNNHKPDQPEAAYSRGSLPLLFLESELGPREWLEEVHSKPDFSECGPFTMLFGVLGADSELLVTSSDALGPQTFKDTLVLSNGTDSSWTKLGKARELVEPLRDCAGQELLKGLWNALSTPSIGPEATMADLRRSVFIPNLSGSYGTRTQTVVLVGHDGTLDYFERQVDGDVSHVEYSIASYCI